MRVVLDTNVLVSGLLSPKGPPARILSLVSSRALQCALDGRILAEYYEVLHRPRLKIDEGKLREVLKEMHKRGLAVSSVPLPSPLPDPSDDAFLEVALSGGAFCLVSGNLVHFPADRCLGLPVYSPARFLEVLRGLPA